MKYIISIIQPGKLEQVRLALADLGLSGMTVSEVQGYGRQLGKTEIYRDRIEIHFQPKVKIEIAVDSKQASKN